MVSDVDWVARFRAESQRIAEYDPEHAAALPTTVLLGEVDRLQAELDGSTSLRDALRRRLEEAGTEIRRLTALLRDHDECAVCGHERRQHRREPVLRRDWCSGCTTADDLHEFKEPTGA